MAWEVAGVGGAVQRGQASHKLASGLEREILLVIAVAYDEKLDQSDKASSISAWRRRSSRKTLPLSRPWNDCTRAPSVGPTWSIP